jgi:hypothetical protein
LHTAIAALRELAWSPDGSTLAFQQRIDGALSDWLGLLTPPDGAVWSRLAEGPYVAETVAVRVEEDCVVSNA